MTTQIYSPSWHRVRHYRPRLPPHAHVDIQHFRGRRWHVIRNGETGQYVRLSDDTYALVGLMDGSRTVDDIWKITCRPRSVRTATQPEIINVLSQLYKVGALVGNVPPGLQELNTRATEIANKKAIQPLRNPLAIKIPLFDPDRLLTTTLPAVRHAYSITGLIIWLLIVGWAGITAAVHWSELTGDLAGRVLAASNILLMALIFPVLKLIHELGHAYAVKAWGGEVHEIGVMLLLFAPTPYVDASASIGFRQKHRRIIVASAGVMAELVVAAAALAVWLAVEPGIVRSVAFNVMFLASVTTLFFNANPLLKFDAYYILSDVIEIPNLAAGATRYWGYLAKRYILGDKATPPAYSGGEKAWMFAYAPLSYVYRIGLSIGIAIFLAQKYLLVGALLAVYSVATSVVVPAFKVAKAFFSVRAKPVRRPLVIAVGAAVIVGLAYLPVPARTVVQGVVMPPAGTAIVAGADGVIDDLKIVSGSPVEAGQSVMQLDNPSLMNASLMKQRQVELLEARAVALEATQLSDALQVQQELAYARDDLAAARVEEAGLVLGVASSGIANFSSPFELIGRYLVRGEVVGYVDDGRMVVLAPISEQNVDLVRFETNGAAIRFSRSGDPQTLDAKLVRLVPAATRDLPSPALGHQAGGDIAVTQDSEGPVSLAPLFTAELEVDGPPANRLLGERVYVRLDHGFRPLAWHVARAMKLLFLQTFPSLSS